MTTNEPEIAPGMIPCPRCGKAVYPDNVLCVCGYGAAGGARGPGFAAARYAAWGWVVILVAFPASFLLWMAGIFLMLFAWGIASLLAVASLVQAARSVRHGTTEMLWGLLGVIMSLPILGSAVYVALQS